MLKWANCFTVNVKHREFEIVVWPKNAMGDFVASICKARDLPYQLREKSPSLVWCGLAIRYLSAALVL